MAVAFVRDHTGVSIKTAGTNNIGVNISTATGAGNTLIARILFDNAATASKPVVSSIAKAAGETNNWVFLGAARSTSTTAGAFASAEIWAIETTVSWPVASYTVTLDTTTVMKATDVREFSGLLATMRSTTGSAYSTTTTAASATTTGTTPQIGDLAVGFIFGSNVAAAQAGDNDTTGGAWSSAATAGIGSTGGNVATNNYGVGQYKILTAASHQTLNNSAAMTAGNGAIVAILQAALDPAISQAAYQWFDEGTETGAVALGAQNTPVNGDINNGDATGTLRVRLQATTAVAVPPGDDWQLQYNYNGAIWMDVTTSSVHIKSYDSPNLTGASASTNRLTGGTGTFVAGEVSEDGQVNDKGWSGSNFTEFVYALKVVAAAVSAGDTLTFRILRNGATATMTYAVTPTINIIRSAVNVSASISTNWSPLPTEALVDSYPETNRNTAIPLGQSAINYSEVAQSFIGNGQKLSKAGFWMIKVGNPAPGPDVSFALRAHTGTFGTTGLPGLVPLTYTPSVIALTAISSGAYAWYELTFDETFTLENGTPYFIGAVISTAGLTNDSNYLNVGDDNSAPTHAGALAFYEVGVGWQTPLTAADAIFRVYTKPLPGGWSAAATGTVEAPSGTDWPATITTNWSDPQLTVTSGMVGWWNGDDASTFSYSSGAVVSQWRDKSPNAYHFDTTTAGPVRNGTINGRTTVTFDGISQHLRRTSIALSKPYSVFAVARSTAATGQGNVFITYPDGRIFQTATGEIALYQGTFLASGIQWGTTDPHLVSAVFNGASSKVGVDGADSVVGEAGTYSPSTGGTWALGSHTPGTSEFWKGDICEVVTYDREPSTVERQQIESYLIRWRTASSGWAASATGTISAPAAPDWPATISSSWGTWTATATATVTPNRPATIASAWGTWTAAAVASIQRYGTIISSWGVWAASATGTIGTPASWGIPQNVVATTTGQTTITVTWDAIPAALSYDVERNGTIVVLDHPASPYNDSGLNPDTLYSYRVRAVG